MGDAIVEAETIERRADALSGYLLMADGLVAALDQSPAAAPWRTAAGRLAAIVRESAGRAGEAGGIARRAIDRLLDLIEEAEDSDDDQLYEAVLTARLHVPIAVSIVDDAGDDAVPAARNLARLALAVAHLDSNRAPVLGSAALGVLRMEPTDGPLAAVAEEALVLWSVTFDELAMELAGLVANLLADHRTFLVIEHAGRATRYVQLLTYDRGLLVESVSDDYLEPGDQLTAADQGRLAELGFAPPAAEGLAGSPNWSIEFDTPVDVHRVAQLLVRTLVDVHGLETPADLELKADVTRGPFASRDELRPMTDPARLERATGALVGSVVGDALGAPFEFGPSGRFGQEFPQRELLGRGEMIGSAVWQPAEWTDDTQMGLLVAQSLLDAGGLDEADLFSRFQAWVAGGPKDVGIQTRSVLTSGLSWDEAAAAHFASGQRAAGNGSLMRATPGAIYFAGSGRDTTMDAARRISALTHGDPAAGEGCAIFHELVRLALEGEDLLDHVDELVDLVPPDLREVLGDAPRSRLRADERSPRQRGGLAGARLGAVGVAHHRLVRSCSAGRHRPGR